MITPEWFWNYKMIVLAVIILMLPSLMLVKSPKRVCGDHYYSLQGYNKKNTYIACQGPMQSTTDEFWRMVWEQCVNTIVMLTNLNEDGKVMM